METKITQAGEIPGTAADKTEVTPKPNQPARKYTPRKKPAGKAPKNRLQWGD